MNYGSKKIVLLYIMILILVIGLILIYIIYQNNTQASELKLRGEVVDQQKVTSDFDGDGNKDKILLSSYYDGMSYVYYISASKSIFGLSEIKLSGFEKEISFCSDTRVKLDNNRYGICLTGFVGAHSQNIQIIRYDGDNFNIVKFIKESKQAENIYSDSPAFQINYDQNLKTASLYIDNRNYEKDPLIDIIRQYYYFKDNAFFYDRSDYLTNQNQSKEEGQIN